LCRTGAKPFRRSRDVEIRSRNHVERLGQQGGKIGVRRIDRHPTPDAPRFPKRTRHDNTVSKRWRSADFHRQSKPQPANCHLLILGLTTPLACFGGDAGRPMLDDDGRLNLVAVLAARTASPLSYDVAIGQQFSFGQ
jgi:hypothetical protein